MRKAPGIFFGILLILIGTGIILKIFLDINLFRSLIALILIFIGLSILFGKRHRFSVGTCTNYRHHGYNSKTIKDIPDNGREYKTIFCKTDYDFCDFEFTEKKPVYTKHKIIAGNSEIKFSRSLPLKIHVNSAFSEVVLPDGNKVNFGDFYYSSPSYNKSENFLNIDAEVVFGSLKFIPC